MTTVIITNIEVSAADEAGTGTLWFNLTGLDVGGDDRPVLTDPDAQLLRNYEGKRVPVTIGITEPALQLIAAKYRRIEDAKRKRRYEPIRPGRVQ